MQDSKIQMKSIALPSRWILAAILFPMLIWNCGGKPGHRNDSEPLTANDILEKIKVGRGICIVLDDQKCELARQLISQSELVLYLQFDNDTAVETACLAADDAGFYGSRIYIDKAEITKINLADNIADAVVVLDETNGMPEAEVLRVLRPGGIALMGQKQLKKTAPTGIDDWSHPFHGADNNPQSNDEVARAPYLTQFLAEPFYAPATQVAVASAGRVFKGFGNIAFHEREEPFLNKLVAFNGYNGTMLWQRDLPAGIMLHRNTIIATPEILYLGDDKSCKCIDTATGKVLDEIIPLVAIAGGTFWKWMGMADDMLYALLGEQEQKDPVMRWRRQQHGWPWTAISPGFNQAEHPWGFGRNVLAINPHTKKVKWHYHEEMPIDSRAICMKNGRIFLFRFGSFLTCLEATSGKVIWRKTPENAPELFATFGDYLTRQGAHCNWRTRDYLMCSDQALYFAGPQINKLVAVSTRDGSILWENPYNNFQLILRDDALYGISAAWGQPESKKFDPLTGAILADLPTSRRACTRPNGAVDAILYRASDGTVRFDLASGLPQWLSPMRPSCHDGVTIANGLLYWWPYVCDCQLSIYGVTCLGPAGNFDFNARATEAERLEQMGPELDQVPGLLETGTDWPSFRKDNKGSVTTSAVIANNGRQLWRFPPDNASIPVTDILGHMHYTIATAPVTADGLVLYGDSHGIVRALDVVTGKLLWQAYTGGAIRMAPTIWQGRVFVGSADGRVYCFAARTGELLWKFRAAPVERKIPVYGSLQSTWPVASGILLDNGIAYFAAGIVNYDGTQVYALDAATGTIRWQNNSCGHLYPEARTGVSVQGHMLLHDGKLYLASGTSVSPAIFDISDGRCLNDPELLKKCEATSPRGWELYLIGDQVVPAGKPFYSHPKHPVYDVTVMNKILHTSNGNQDFAWINQKKVMCFPPIDRQTLASCVSGQTFTGYPAPLTRKLEPTWQYNCDGSVALAVCQNAVVVAEKAEIVVLDLNGKIRWTCPLEYAPVPWGLAISRDGSIIVTLEDGSMQCLGGEPTLPVANLASNNAYFMDSARVVLSCKTKDAEIRYSLDGSEPTQNSSLYTRPFVVTNSGTLKMRAFTKTGIPGFVVSEEFHQVDYSKASDLKDVKVGLAYDYFEGSFTSVSDLEQLQPVKSGTMTRFELAPNPGVEQFGYIYRGYILVPGDGDYTFYLASNDGSKLYLNGDQVIDNDGGHTVIEMSRKLTLKAGEHPVVVKYFQMGAAKALRVCWDGPGFGKQDITAEAVFHKDSR